MERLDVSCSPHPSQGRFKFTIPRARTTVKYPWVARGRGMLKLRIDQCIIPLSRFRSFTCTTFLKTSVCTLRNTTLIETWTHKGTDLWKKNTVRTCYYFQAEKKNHVHGAHATSLPLSHCHRKVNEKWFLSSWVLGFSFRGSSFSLQPTFQWWKRV